EVCFPANHTDVQDRSVSETAFEEQEANHLVPLLLSLGHYPVITGMRADADTTRAPAMIAGTGRVFGIYTGNRELQGEGDMDLGIRMVSMMATDRFLQQAFWLDVGRAFYSATTGDIAGLTAWVDQTERALRGRAA